MVRGLCARARSILPGSRKPEPAKSAQSRSKLHRQITMRTRDSMKAAAAQAATGSATRSLKATDVVVDVHSAEGKAPRRRIKKHRDSRKHEHDKQASEQGSEQESERQHMPVPATPATSAGVV